MTAINENLLKDYIREEFYNIEKDDLLSEGKIFDFFKSKTKNILDKFRVSPELKDSLEKAAEKSENNNNKKRAEEYRQLIADLENRTFKNTNILTVVGLSLFTYMYMNSGNNDIEEIQKSVEAQVGENPSEEDIVKYISRKQTITKNSSSDNSNSKARSNRRSYRLRDWLSGDGTRSIEGQDGQSYDLNAQQFQHWKNLQSNDKPPTIEEFVQYLNSLEQDKIKQSETNRVKDEVANLGINNDGSINYDIITGLDEEITLEETNNRVEALIDNLEKSNFSKQEIKKVRRIQDSIVNIFNKEGEIDSTMLKWAAQFKDPNLDKVLKNIITSNFDEETSSAYLDFYNNVNDDA